MQENEKRQKLDDIISQLMVEMTTKCSCIFNINGEAFSCRGSEGNFENTVVFRGRVTVQDSSVITADDVVNDINNWVKSSPSVTVGLATLDIDSNCPAMLASIDSDDCVVAPEQPSSSDSFSIGIIVGAIPAVIVLMVIIIVVILVYLRTKGSYW